MVKLAYKLYFVRPTKCFLFSSEYMYSNLPVYFSKHDVHKFNEWMVLIVYVSGEDITSTTNKASKSAIKD